MQKVNQKKNSNEYKTFENKSITKNHGMQSKCIEYKMFESKYGNTCNAVKCLHRLQICKVSTCSFRFNLFVVS